MWVKNQVLNDDPGFDFINRLQEILLENNTSNFYILKTKLSC